MRVYDIVVLVITKVDCFYCCAAKVIVDRETGRSRGFGFVNFTDETAANTAISEMDGKVSILVFC